MRLFGFEISRKKSHVAPVDNRGGWFPWIREPYAGAWQNNDSWTIDSVLAYHAVYACISLISSDIGKLPVGISRIDGNGIWSPSRGLAKAKVLKKPNRFQNHIQFKEWWMISKLVRGNVYVLKERDPMGVVVRLYVLDPCRVQVLVSTDGSVYYQLAQDALSGQEETSVTVPASEIIHDRMNCLFHPLVGVSPLFASGLAASQGLKIQNDSNKFFENGASPGGVLTAPGAIGDDTAARLKAHWDANYSGVNAGKVAVLGDGLKFEPMRMTAVDSQLIEQLKWTAQVVCSTFHVPAWKVGVGDRPANTNIEAQTKDYYSQCLQTHIESMELCLDEGLELDDGFGTELDLDVLFRMDSQTLMNTLKEGVGAGIMAPDEARKRLNLSSVDGGKTPYLQQQNYSLSALAARDATNPLALPAPAPVPEPAPAEDAPEDVDDQARMFALLIEKELSSAIHS
jgi:HK97 family phage portal protein